MRNLFFICLPLMAFSRPGQCFFRYSSSCPITVVAVLITGIFGSIAAPLLIKLFRVKDPMTAGLAIGASSHAVGTSKALELGETEGAMSGLAIGVCGLITVVLSLFLM